jgi:3-mercaptopyruvate sulfurtransferase SseA
MDKPQGNLTKIVVMDSSGSNNARDLARALVSLGYQLSYVMEGGFKAWAAAELAVVEDAVEYDASTGAVLGDELEVIAEKANEVVTTVTQPQVRPGAALLFLLCCCDCARMG